MIDINYIKKLTKNHHNMCLEIDDAPFIFCYGDFIQDKEIDILNFKNRVIIIPIYFKNALFRNQYEYIINQRVTIIYKRMEYLLFLHFF